MQIGDDPNAGGHDTVSLTEIEDGATTSDQTEVASAGAPRRPPRNRLYRQGRCTRRAPHPRRNERAERRRRHARHRRADDFADGLHGSVISGGDSTADAAGHVPCGSGEGGGERG